MYTLEVSGVTKYFGKACALDNVNFQVSDSELFALVGPSGSGKTTILRIICGLETADSGKVILDGRNISKLEPGARNISMMFQSPYGLLPFLNVFDNIAFGLKTRRLDSSGIEMRVVGVAHTLGIYHLLQRKIAHLSGGEQQRVALARLLVRETALSIFDEPLSHIDAHQRQHTLREILLVHRMKHRPSIYVTHDHVEAFAVASRIAVLANGRVQQIGTRDELLHTPANLFVAQFMSTPPMNLVYGYLQGAYTQEGMRFRVLSRDFSLPLPMAWTQFIQRNNWPEVVVGVRPEAIVPLGGLDAVAAKSYFRLYAEIVGHEGHEKSITVRLKVGIATELNALMYDMLPENLRTGQRMVVGIDIARLCLFDPRDGRLLLGPQTAVV
ncbi:ABC transporter ATP-binding protein [Ktedonosporobacter rubrisoli]|uniref:ABC transporter ATP-binding protein n=1 Tax=Ktedonosporobacter rubrisoli TaxID=2509675 RepID=A0A4P6JYJ5_KTERU|nr:ABC transporter ATP-binding protein [Ktedonosporobacter rubrisoli]QBD80552.1 ABC transporter ATP-binding protein [Ktedonosporobacter rubrisoli]